MEFMFYYWRNDYRCYFYIFLSNNIKGFNMSEFDIPKFYAAIPEKLVHAQNMLEKAIEAYGLASDEEATTLMEYRKVKGETILELSRTKTPATYILEVAQGKTAELKYKAMVATGKRTKVAKLVDAYRERIYTLRHMNKSIEGMK